MKNTCLLSFSKHLIVNSNNNTSFSEPVPFLLPHSCLGFLDKAVQCDGRTQICSQAGLDLSSSLAI